MTQATTTIYPILSKIKINNIVFNGLISLLSSSTSHTELNPLITDKCFFNNN